MSKPIGTVLYDETATLAKLWPGGKWTVERLGQLDAAAGESLTRYYRNEYGPSDGNPALLALHDLTDRTNGSLMINDDELNRMADPLAIS
jgi:hypothetical protein